jgi:hypothetical protein
MERWQDMSRYLRISLLILFVLFIIAGVIGIFFNIGKVVSLVGLGISVIGLITSILSVNPNIFNIPNLNIPPMRNFLWPFISILLLLGDLILGSLLLWPIVHPRPLSASEIYNNVAKTEPDIADPLDGKSYGINWSIYREQNSSGTLSCSFANNAYHVIAIPTANSPYPVTMCFARSLPIKLDNYVLQVDINFPASPNSGGGIIYRSKEKGLPTVDQQAQAVMYRAHIGSSDSTYDIYVQKEDLSTSGRLYACDHPEDSNATSPIIHQNGPSLKNLAIRQNQPNTIIMVVRGNVATLMVNGQELLTVCDATSTSGGIGFFAAANHTEVDAAFTNLKIWKL